MDQPTGISQQHRDRIASNWQAVMSDVAAAAEAAGRSASEITIVGVTKYVDAATTAALVDAGCRNLGENRPQVLWEKADSDCINKSIQWHVIGHLQRNKVRRTLRYQQQIESTTGGPPISRPPIVHSVDSDRLLKSIASESIAAGVTTEVLLEVNISGDASKTGMDREQLVRVLEDLTNATENVVSKDRGVAGGRGGVQVIGLMAMAGWGTENQEARQQFAEVRQIRDSVASSDHPLPELSMGMSGDFAEAIAEGSTMVRIGSRLFEGVMEPR
jgi:pyridoxal phosphate enzyme (YggS family)